MINEQQYSSEDFKIVENKNNSMVDDARIRLINAKSKVEKAISCSSLLVEIYRDNLEQIKSTKDNKIVVELENSNKSISKTYEIVKENILQDLQILLNDSNDKSAKVDNLTEKIQNLQSKLNEENKTEIVDELNVYITEMNNIELVVKIYPNILNEYNRFSIHVNNLI